MTYKEILENQKLYMPAATKWWTNFFFHFTDVHNASQILFDGWIYSRQKAVEKEVMTNDNASKAVIEATSTDSKCYGRLYFRPLTPTQYHNEGYKPSEIRDANINANCPVPVFFCLSSHATLNYPGTKFAEKGIAGQRHEICEGVDAFAELNFRKIYHNRSFAPENSDIIQFRHSEVIRENGFPVEPLLRCILCRTLAERETLLFLLKQHSARLYNTYKEKVLYKPSVACFFNNGIFVKRVSIMDKMLKVEFNDPELRKKKRELPELQITVNIEIMYKNQDGRVLNVSNGMCVCDYYSVRICSMDLKENIQYDLVRIRVHIDDAVMYENEIDMNDVLF